MDVALVSIAVDSKEELGQEAKRLNIQTPMLSDEDAAVTKSYGIRWRARAHIRARRQRRADQMGEGLRRSAKRRSYVCESR